MAALYPSVKRVRVLLKREEPKDEIDYWRIGGTAICFISSIFMGYCLNYIISLF